MNYIDTLTYYSTPDYNYLRQMINLAMKNNDINPNEPYDWQQQTITTEDDEVAPDPMNNNTVKITPQQTEDIINNLNGLLKE